MEFSSRSTQYEEPDEHGFNDGKRPSIKRSTNESTVKTVSASFP
jgi:hypothetical protein